MPFDQPRHPDVRQPNPLLRQRRRNDPQGPPVAPHGQRDLRGLLLGLAHHEVATFAAPVAEGNRPAEIPPSGLLIRLDLADPLANAIALRLGESRRDGQEQLAQPIARDVAAKVQQMQPDPARLQRLNHGQGVQRRPEQPVQLGGDDNIPPRQPVKQRAPTRALGDRDRPRHPLFDNKLSQFEPVHQHITLDLPALNVQALALARLPRRRHPAISVDHWFPLSAR